MEGVFWRHALDCLPQGWAIDGLDPENIETTKNGIVISCSTSFLPTGTFETIIQLSRPYFTNIHDFTEKKLVAARIAHSEVKDGNLWVEIEAEHKKNLV